MANIQDATVAASAYDTSGNGGRKLVRLSNGWLVAVVANQSTWTIYFEVSKDNGTTWNQLCYRDSLTSSGTVNVSISGYGTMIYCLVTTTSGPNNLFYRFDASTITNVNLTSSVNIDISQTAFGANSLAINDTGTKLLALWASKNSTYASSFNLRSAEGTINADGSVTWGTVVQGTTINTTGYDVTNPVSLYVNGIPKIIAQYKTTSNNYIRQYGISGSTFALDGTIYDGGAYAQSNPSAIFVPQNINGLTNGRIHVSWVGKDGTETTADNIRYAYSDDGGVTWSAMTKLTTGTTVCGNPSVTATRINDIFIAYSRVYNTGSGYSNLRYFKNTGGVWSGSTNLTPGTVENAVYPATLFDLSISATVPLLIYKNTTSPKVGFYGTWTVTTISVTQGSVGNKTDKSNLLTYAITTDGTMSTITEKVNGVTIGTKTATSGQSLIAGLTQAQWDAIKYGKYADATGGANTLTVEMGSEKWTYTFDKRLATDADILSAVKAAQDSQTTYLPSVKAKLGGAIRGKGGTVNDTDSWDAMVSAVGGISIGLANATGTATSGSILNSLDSSYNGNSAVASFYTLAVSGLSFKPKYIIVYRSGFYDVTVYWDAADLSGQSNSQNIVSCISSGMNGGGIGDNPLYFKSFYVKNDSFAVPVSAASTSYYWVAIG